MEKEPSQEPKWASDSCGNESCAQEFEVRPENSRIDSFRLMPDCNYIFTHCPHCEEYYMKLFLKSVGKQEFLDAGFEEFVAGDYPPQHIIESYKAIYGEEPFDPRKVEVSALTPRQEHLAWFVAYLLHKELLTVEDFDGEGDLFI